MPNNVKGFTEMLQKVVDAPSRDDLLTASDDILNYIEDDPQSLLDDFTATAKKMAGALAVLRAVYDEMEDHYDGVPDSTTLWMAHHMDAIQGVIRKAGA